MVSLVCSVMSHCHNDLKYTCGKNSVSISLSSLNISSFLYKKSKNLGGYFFEQNLNIYSSLILFDFSMAIFLSSTF